MELGILPDLTKTYILERISQEEIMEKYLGIPVVFDKLVLAPPIIRNNDESPTCSFYYNNQGRLRFRDFSGAFWGDCFDVVALHLRVDSKGSRAFQLILHTIAKDFRIHKYKDYNEVQKYDQITRDFFKKKKAKKRVVFNITFRQWNYHDASYWKKFNIDSKLLEIGYVFPAENIYRLIDGYPDRTYKYDPKDPAYCYWGGKDINGVDLWKIYYPKRKRNGGRPRFHSNSSFLQGKHLITGGRIGIITKSYKDVLAFRSFGLEAVAPSAESVLISKDDYHYMKSHFDILISCMDYDKAGIRMMKKMWKAYRIQPMMFTNGTNDTFDYGVKDFAEHVEHKGVKKTSQLLLSIFDKYKYDLYELDTYFYKKLKFIQ